jgi:hypothetical protein
VALANEGEPPDEVAVKFANRRGKMDLFSHTGKQSTRKKSLIYLRFFRNFTGSNPFCSRCGAERRFEERDDSLFKAAATERMDSRSLYAREAWGLDVRAWVCGVVELGRSSRGSGYNREGEKGVRDSPLASWSRCSASLWKGCRKALAGSTR